MTSCTTEKEVEKQLTKVLEKRPDLIFKVIENKPVEFMETIRTAAIEARRVSVQRRYEREQKEIESSIEKPLQPIIRNDEAKKFKMTGTPGFILNGVPIRGGAVPISIFEKIIEKLRSKGKIFI